MFGFQPFRQARENPIDLLFTKAKELHQKGVDGDRNAVIEALSLLERIRFFRPGNPLVNAFYGSAIALLGRDAVDPQERMEKAQKGLKILDDAVDYAPDNVDIRVLRGYVSFRLPNMFFRRTKTAIEDFEYLIARYEQSPEIFAEEFYWHILFNLGVAYKTLHQGEKAENIWNKLLEKTTNPKYRDLVNEKKANPD